MKCTIIFCVLIGVALLQVQAMPAESEVILETRQTFGTMIGNALSQVIAKIEPDLKNFAYGTNFINLIIGIKDGAKEITDADVLNAITQDKGTALLEKFWRIVFMAAIKAFDKTNISTNYIAQFVAYLWLNVKIEDLIPIIFGNISGIFGKVKAAAEHAQEKAPILKPEQEKVLTLMAEVQKLAKSYVPKMQTMIEQFLPGK